MNRPPTEVQPDAGEGKSSADIVREAALSQAASLLVYIGISVAITVAIAKRDALTRAWMRYKRWARRDPEKIRRSRLLAELRRDISLIEHSDEQPRGRTTPRGLYEGECKP